MRKALGFLWLGMAGALAAAPLAAEPFAAGPLAGSLAAGSPDRATAGTSAVRSWHIEEFRSDIGVLASGRIEVTETIRVRFDGSFNGIFRDIPVQYRGARGFNYTLRLSDIAVTDDAGNELEFETSSERHYRRVKIWVPGANDASRTVVIRYSVANGLRWFDEDDVAWTELYWNITGDEWPVRIERASARIVLPGRATGIRARAFTGAYGSTASDAELTISGTAIEARTSSVLGINQGLTVTVAWDTRVGGQPDGAYVIAPPTRAERVGAWLYANWPIFLPLLVLIGMLQIWRRLGRDPSRLAVAPRYEPPDALSVAEAGALIDNKADMRDVTAMIVDLAVRGFLTIEKGEQSQFLGIAFGSDPYTFRLKRGREEYRDLTAHERQLLDALFDGRPGDTVSTDDLKNSFYKDLPGIRDALWNSLVSRGFYRTRPDLVMAGWLIAAAVVGIAGTVGGAALSAAIGMSPLAAAVGAILSGIIIAAFGTIMPARTMAGARAQEQALGFEEFLGRVEADRLQRLVGGPEDFERFLPYAMAFGVEDHWAKVFADLYQDRQPSWYSGPSGSRFHSSSLTSDLSGMASSTSSAMQSAPRSSGGSGFSGGGGGGFSGGGFGGGGGGAF